jgi:tetratricopeptide (TPR) repeat protein
VSTNREEELRARISAEPLDAEVIRELAELIGSDRTRKEEAIELWKRYVDAVEPSRTAEALLRLGRAQVEARREDEAIDTLRRCIEEASDCFAALDLMGELLRRAGRLEEAVEALGRAAELDDQAIRPRVALVTCLDALGRSGEAEAVLEVVRAIGAGDPAVMALVRELTQRRD